MSLMESIYTEGLCRHIQWHGYIHLFEANSPALHPLKALENFMWFLSMFGVNIFRSAQYFKRFSKNSGLSPSTLDFFITVKRKLDIRETIEC